jgi:hypothetical protein
MHSCGCRLGCVVNARLGFRAESSIVEDESELAYHDKTYLDTTQVRNASF